MWLSVNTSAMSCSVSTILKAVVESRPEVGSSRNKRDGLIIISFPMHTRFLSPPETPRTKEPPIMVSWQLVSYIAERSDTSQNLLIAEKN